MISNVTSVSANSSNDGRVAGTYQYFRDDERITRDLTGNGTRSINVDADALNYVRVQGSSSDELYRLTISQDGHPIYDSKSVLGRRPIFYHPVNESTSLK